MLSVLLVSPSVLLKARKPRHGTVKNRLGTVKNGPGTVKQGLEPLQKRLEPLAPVWLVFSMAGCGEAGRRGASGAVLSGAALGAVASKAQNAKPNPKP